MEILLNKPGKKIILLGNEAIVRGALEEGVNFVSTYPGTPASEIGDTFFKIQNSKFPPGVRLAKGGKIQNLDFEYSANEKVALEGAIGAAFCGLKSLVALKHFGLNVCIEALIPVMYTGIKGALVLVVSDDVSCWSSAQSEQNSRAYSYLSHIPTLEPSDPQECKDFIKLAFQISKKFQIPVMIRTTTRVSHQRAPVKLGKIARGDSSGKFEKNPKRWVTMPPRVLEMKKELLEKIRKIKELSQKIKINLIYPSPTRLNSKIGVITSGISYLYVMEALKEFTPHQPAGGGLPVLKLGFFYPLPEEKIKNFIKNLKKVLIVEELEPYLEKEVERLAKEANPKLKIFGKNLLPEVGEFRPEIVRLAITKFTNKKFQSKILNLKSPILKRFPRLCSGCPYWLVLSALKKAVNSQKVIFGGDIGCYMLFGCPPLNFQDYLSSMGSSIGIAHGIKKSTRQKLITFIGDSTFFHAGIPALINTVFNKSNPLIIILDNKTTAMTGFQPHPGKVIKIEDIVRACGIKNLKIIDPIDIEEMSATIKEFLTKKESSVIISRRLCALLAKKQEK